MTTLTAAQSATARSVIGHALVDYYRERFLTDPKFVDVVVWTGFVGLMNCDDQQLARAFRQSGLSAPHSTAYVNESVRAFLDHYTEK